MSGSVEVLLRPEDLRILPAAEAIAGGCDADVELVEYYGHDTVYVVRLVDGTRLRARESAAPTFTRGQPVSVRFAGAATHAYVAGRPAVVGDAAAGR